MDVWLVIKEIDWEGYQILDVFRDKETAFEYAEEYMKDKGGDWKQVMERMYWEYAYHDDGETLIRIKKLVAI